MVINFIGGFNVKKKTLKTILLAVCLLSLLTGCYKQDTVVSVGPMGGIKAETTFVGTDEAIAQYGEYEEVKESFKTDAEQYILYKSREKVEETKKTVNGKELKGFKISVKYDSLDEMMQSTFWNSIEQYYVPTPVLVTSKAEIDYIKEQNKDTGKDVFDELEIPVMYKEGGIFGTSYYVKGNVVFRRDAGAAETENPDAIKDATVDVSFKFPIGSFTTSAGNKNILKPSFAYSVSDRDDKMPVDICVFVPNYLGIFAVILIIGLIIAVVLLAIKVAKLSKFAKGAETTSDDKVVVEEILTEDDKNFFEGSEEKIDVSQEPRKKDEE